jgi:SRSO17 transposase
MSVAVWSGSGLAWDQELTALKRRLASIFRRSDVAASAAAFIDGLLSGISRKTGWQMAEQAGLSRPYRMQSLLGRSSWSADALRDRVRAEAVASLADPSGVLVVDETGFLKKGEHSVGVARQYSGTAGRIENCQVGVFLAYASRFGQALIDRRLYLPEAWASDKVRRRRVQVPDAIEFATKPRIACDLIAAALDAGVPCAWVLADALYGSDSRLRRMLEARGQPYVLAVRSNQTLRMLTAHGFLQTDPAQMADELPAERGRRTPPARVRKVCGSTTGRASRCPGWRTAASSAGCSSVAIGAIGKTAPIISYSHGAALDSPSWPAPPAYAGPSRSASSAPRRNWGSTTAKPAPGMDGIVT